MLLGAGHPMLSAGDDAGSAACWSHQEQLLHEDHPVLLDVSQPHVILRHIQLLQQWWCDPGFCTLYGSLISVASRWLCGHQPG